MDSYNFLYKYFSTRNKGNFQWKPMEQMEKFVKCHIKLNSVPNLLGGVQLNAGGLK
jgi:hypothetical protein